MNRRHVVIGTAIAAVVILAAAVSPDRALGLLEWLSAEPVRFALALFALAAIRPFLAWPTTLLAVAVGFGYGWIGVPFAALLLTLTALPPYALARAGRTGIVGRGDDVDRRKDIDREGDVDRGNDVDRGSDGASDDGLPGRSVLTAGERFVDVAGGVRTIAATRFLPLPADVISIAAGAANVRLRPFLIGTAIGEFPWVIAGVAIGVSTDRLVAGDLSVVDPTLFLAMAAAAVILLAGPLYRAYYDRATQRRSA
ncbi:TVP38/TMEM64 family protein [Halorubrum vacuolatum]|uniref:Uncharacterized membrane protein YdjX, TVP38/TMEM64 family, SNARE-associated domain n=1 Tax=Halorubrum vacuolatum TaxID=63740 RepID=A0A238X702_HALVU|nr:VTT domain-containing protein [Halorubrum vacuolatum]SNR54361.1 Uncharacterized membrane protein YdjX, TVP38/TMEM64 family, SNARE-associated domain [Halorubrum vacuolatum]